MVCASIYAWFFIHDTKGLRMDEMDKLFGFNRAEQNAVASSNGKIKDDNEHIEKAVSVRVSNARA
jgi:hypothetical protein